MWRSICTRSHLTRNLGIKPSLCSSQSQVFYHICFNSSSCSTNLFTRIIPTNFTHQNLRFLSQSSSISSSENENEVGGDALDVNSSKDSSFKKDFDKNGGMNGSHVISLWSIDKFTGEKSDSDDDIFGNGDVGSDDVDLDEGVRSETIDVENLESVRYMLQSTADKSLEASLNDFVKEVGNENGVVSVHILNRLISVLAKFGQGKAVFEVFGKFDDLGCVPNVRTYYLTISALCKQSFYDWAVSVSQKMIDVEMIPSRGKVGSIIRFYCKGRRCKDAYDVYFAARRKNIYPPQRATKCLISCLSKLDETVPLAKEILDDFPVEYRKHVINPFSWVVCGLCRIKDIDGGKKLLLEMIEKGPPPGKSAFDSLIFALSKAGKLEDAKEMLQLMVSRGLTPAASSYSVTRTTVGNEKFMEEACKVLADAKKKDPDLYPPTFRKLIEEYSQQDHFDEAVKLLGDLKKFGVELDEDERKKLIRYLCVKAIDCETAEKLLEEMKTEEMHLPWLSRALRNKLKEQEREPDSPVDICGQKYDSPAPWIETKQNGVDT